LGVVLDSVLVSITSALEKQIKGEKIHFGS
jgi:hypothetical protein